MRTQRAVAAAAAAFPLLGRRHWRPLRSIALLAAAAAADVAASKKKWGEGRHLRCDGRYFESLLLMARRTNVEVLGWCIIVLVMLDLPFLSESRTSALEARLLDSHACTRLAGEKTTSRGASHCSL